MKYIYNENGNNAICKINSHLIFVSKKGTLALFDKLCDYDIDEGDGSEKNISINNAIKIIISEDFSPEKCELLDVYIKECKFLAPEIKIGIFFFFFYFYLLCLFYVFLLLLF
jgi:hypothetical protein